ncbi:MAG: agarase [Verrucomicrobiota bacterium]
MFRKALLPALLLLLVGPDWVAAADWDPYPVPADPGVGKEWQLLPVSDDFNYSAPAVGKSEEFNSRWRPSFINNWMGPGLTEWNPTYSSVEGGNLVIRVARKPGTQEIYAGCISSHGAFEYPLYMEVCAKVNTLTMASAAWLLSADSTEEIDTLEAYGSDRPDQTWWAERVHISHHVFIRNPFQDYQPLDAGTWYRDGTIWADGFHRYGMYWRDPWHLEYYINGVHVRTVSGESIIDPRGYTNGTGLSKPMHIIMDTEDQDWRSDNGVTPTDAELLDPARNTYLVDWIRMYKPVPKKVLADIETSGQEIQLAFGEGVPFSLVDLVASEQLTVPLANWAAVVTGLQFDEQGMVSVQYPMTKDLEFFALRDAQLGATYATFDWEEHSGDWWVAYNQTETNNGVTMIAGGRTAANDGGDGFGGANGYGFKANYAQDAVDGTLRFELSNQPVQIQLVSINIRAEEGAQPDSVYLEGLANGAVMWTIDPTNDVGFVRYNTATTGSLALPIDEIVWHGPTETAQNPGGTLWDNAIDDITIRVHAP